MPVTLEAVREELEAEEPDYEALAASFGAAALTHLAELARLPDPMVAPRAVYLAALIPDPRATRILAQAARSPDTRWRVAAAAAAADLSVADASAIVTELIGDPDPGVRRAALRSIPLRPGPALETALRSRVRLETEPYVQEEANKALARVTRPEQ
jgi:HEAT repeat protein